MTLSLSEFLKRLAASGLVRDDDMRQVQQSLPRELLPPDDARPFAAALVSRGLLTQFQAATIAQGEVESLVFGNYVVLEQIGRGGMGLVYKAEHRRMKRVVALKVLSKQAMQSTDAIARFRREVEAAARLSHPNIVAAYDADEAHGVHYLVMEYVDGADLATLVINGGPLSPADAVDCIVQGARGLAQAHEAGIVHRDIKPGNLLLDRRGVVKILDMGLARVIPREGAASASLTQSGTIMGTADYMSPEQARDTHQADRRSDIYSLGCTLHFLLTGRAVYAGETPLQRLVAHRNQPVPSLCQWLADVPAELDAVFQKMIAKEPDDRYQTMGAVIEALQPVIASVSAALPADDAGQTAAATPAASGQTEQIVSASLARRLASLVPTGEVPPRRAGISDTSAGQAAQQTTVTRPAWRRKPAGSAQEHRVAWPAIGAGLSVVVILGTLVWRAREWAAGPARPAAPPAEVGHKGEAPARQAIRPADGWVELLPLIDVHRDTAQGKWRLLDTFVGGVLEGAAESDGGSEHHAARLMVPCQPSGGHELTFVFSRVSGHGSLRVFLPVENSLLVLALVEAPNSFEKASVRLETGDRSLLAQLADDVPLENEHAYRLELAVEKHDDTVTVLARLDDNDYRWSGPLDRLRPLAADAAERSTSLEFEVTSAVVQFRDMQLRVLDGEAKVAAEKSNAGR